MQELVLGNSIRFKEAVEVADRYAPHHWPVLLLGETGVGKELLARRIHFRSPRGRCPFVPVNCAALPAGLFESELFGFEKGAFSGALQSARGLVRQANTGTLFLDEIGELDFGLQGKLLRLLDSGEVRPVGSARVESVDIRILAATNVDLHRAVAHGTFRRDLLERLRVLSLHLPPLRERAEDIVPLSEGWLHEIGATFEPDALPSLVDFEWPGNVRQLRNLLIRTSVLGAGHLTRRAVDKMLAEERALIPSSVTEADLLQGSLAEIEKQVIVEKLKQCHGNRKQTATELGIAKSTLHEKLRKWKQDGTPFVPPLSPYVSSGGISHARLL